MNRVQHCNKPSDFYVEWINTFALSMFGIKKKIASRNILPQVAIVIYNNAIHETHPLQCQWKHSFVRNNTNCTCTHTVKLIRCWRYKRYKDVVCLFANWSILFMIILWLHYDNNARLCRPSPLMIISTPFQTILTHFINNFMKLLKLLKKFFHQIGWQWKLCSPHFESVFSVRRRKISYFLRAAASALVKVNNANNSTHLIQNATT